MSFQYKGTGKKDVLNLVTVKTLHLGQKSEGSQKNNRLWGCSKWYTTIYNIYTYHGPVSPSFNPGSLQNVVEVCRQQKSPRTIKPS